MESTAKMMITSGRGNVQSCHKADKKTPASEVGRPSSQVRRRRSTCQSHVNEKRVAFSDVADVRAVKDLRVECKDKVWFSKDDFDMFRFNAARLTRTMEKEGTTLAQRAVSCGDTSVFLGLEKHFSQKTNVDIRYRREEVYNAVRSEQRRQRFAGIEDPDKLAEVSAGKTAFCRRRARIIGLLHILKGREPAQCHSPRSRAA
mmetsp:Transcript_46432/g.97582  ORF Transcript_46432/g.97582 Transcript_46432/m.97582 type:complete len:202 (-) Transcript_46432:88-693(-)